MAKKKKKKATTWPEPKRIFDVAVSSAALVGLSPMLAAIALQVKLSSPGPILYRGVRVGKNGKKFRILKFRTMVVDAEKKGGGTTALNDPRVTSVGRFLRRHKLDELPQLINVLVGEMSLVGPRPELPKYTDRYQGDEKLILSVRPGITDFSSIRFSALDEAVGAVDADRVFEEKVLKTKNELRVKYVREQSFVTDLRILAETAAKLLVPRKKPT